MALRIFSIIIFLFAVCLSHAQTAYKRQFTFVPSSFKCEISHLAYDKLGYLWISTDEGLVRYDGYTYMRFQHKSGDTLSLPNNSCHKSYIDSDDNLWVATQGGLAKLDRSTYKVKSIQVDTTEVAIIDMAEDSDKSLWLLGYNAIYHYYPSTGMVDVLRGRWGGRFIVTASHLWVVSQKDGLTFIDKNTKEVSYADKTVSKSLCRIFQASNGQVFVGAVNNGLYIFSQDRKLEQHYESNKDGALFSSNHLCSFAEDDRNNIWIGAINGNLSIYNLRTKSFVPSRLMFPEGVNDQHITISSILCDSNHNVWVGTYRYWFFKSAVKDEVFTYHKLPDGNPASSFMCRDGKPLLVGSDGGGVYSFDPLKRQAFSSTLNLNSESVASLRSFKNGGKKEIYVSTWGDGLFIEQGSNKAVPFAHDLPTNKIQDVLPTDTGLWVAADDYGVMFVTKTGKVLSDKNSNLPIFNPKLPRFPRQLLSDMKGRLWVCSSNGLVCWNGKKCEIYKIDEYNSNDVIMVDDDLHNNIWFLSKAFGLCQLDPASGEIEQYSQKFGLPIGLKALLIDDNNVLWVTSADHIFRINLATEDVRNFDFSDQLNSDVFHPRSLYCGEYDVLYAGSSAGFFAVQKYAIQPPVCQSVVLSSFSLFGVVQTPSDSSILHQDISLCEKLELSYEQNMFSFTFVCPNYSGPDFIEYYYQLGGLSDSWLKADGHGASFSSLPAGTYTLNVRAMAGDRVLGTLAHPMTIVVKPAWWDTWTFRIFVLLFISLLVYLAVAYRFRFLKKQQQNLEKQVAMRTRELAERNDEILKQNKNIESKNNELDVALTTKDRIISVIAHDLRNPLSVINGMLNLLQNNTEVKASCDLLKQIDTASNAALNLQNQMENLLQWARLQSSSIVFSPTEVFVSYSVRGAITLLQDVARQKGISITVNDSSTHAAIADERMVATIFRNLLANAIKFSFANTTIEVDIIETDDCVQTLVKDHGTGISPELLPTIFADSKASSLVSKNGTAGEEGAGLGLRICHDFATRCKGNLTVSSTVGLGSVFTLSLPKGELSYDKQAENISLHNEIQETQTSSEHMGEDVDRKLILFVDDDVNILNYLTAIFQNEFVVETASNGAEGLQIARKTLPNIIISDLMMPMMNGKEFCEHIKTDSLTQHIPVLLLTASDSDVTHVESLTAGADDYILKPVHRDILLAKVRTVLNNKELQLQHYRSQLFSVSTEEGPVASPDSEFIEKATKIVKEHIADSDFTAEVFASEMAISRVQLFRKFKAVAATSPSEFVRQYRLMTAAEMLSAGNVSVSDVAYACGFSDPKYFSSCFSARFGVSPSHYSKNKTS